MTSFSEIIPKGTLKLSGRGVQIPTFETEKELKRQSKEREELGKQWFRGVKFVYKRLDRERGE